MSLHDMNLHDFHFLRPVWLFALIPLAILAWMLIKRRLRHGSWAVYCDAPLLEYLLLDQTTQQRGWPVYLYGLAGALAIVALAGPTWEQLPSPVFRNDEALVIALDLSHSMNATDIKPNRLERARFKIDDLLDRRKDGQTALVVYAGDAFTVTPLTDDIGTIRNLLSSLTTDIMPTQGSRTDRALRMARELFEKAGLQNGRILLITDGASLEQTEKVARELNTENFLLSVFGVGTEQGAPVPLGEGGFLKDKAGNIVIPRLRSNTLRKIAAAGGGIYLTLQNDSQDIDQLMAAIDQRPSQEQSQETDMHIEQWRELGPWLLLPLLPIAAFAFRKGFLVAALLGLYAFPDPASAFEWQNLWLTPDQRARKAYQQGSPEEAAKTFENREWKAASQYSAGQYDKSLQTLDGIDNSEALYNKGNALAQLGRFSEALQAYQKSLDIDPENEDAAHNKEVVEKAMKAQQQSQQGDGQNQENQQDRENDQQNQSQEQQANQAEKSQNQSNGGQDKNRTDNNAGEPDRQDSEERQQDETVNREEQQARKPDTNEPSQQQSNATTKNGKPEQQNNPALAENEPTSANESEQATEQWLRRIPDDPGGLLRRKFKYQYQRNKRQAADENEPW